MKKYISLGTNCSVAYQLRKLGLREEAYPFDWCSTNYKNLLEVLKNDFKDYEKVSIKKFSDNHILFKNEDVFDEKVDKKGTYIFKNGYGITFAHELIEENDENIDKFKETINRRIKRFRELDGNIVFIRIEINDKIFNYNELIEILDKKFLNYKIIILGNIEYEKTSNGNIDYEKTSNGKIEYYKLPEFKDWKYDNFDWNIIFN